MNKVSQEGQQKSKKKIQSLHKVDPQHLKLRPDIFLNFSILSKC